MLNQAEVKLIQDGYFHMVNNGYSKLTTPQDIVKVLEANLEYFKRQKSISNNIDRVENPNADVLISFLEPMIKNLEARLKF